MTDFLNTAAVHASGLSANHSLAAVLSGRDDIPVMTEQAHYAALTPDEPRFAAAWRDKTPRRLWRITSPI